MMFIKSKKGNKIDEEEAEIPETKKKNKKINCGTNSNQKSSPFLKNLEFSALIMTPTVM